MKKKRKTGLLILATVMVLLMGICAVCYPFISARYENREKSEVITEYYDTVQKQDDSELRAAILSAQEYNRKIFSGEYSLLEPEENGYYEELNILSNGIMGYIDIPKIDIYLPIYHGIGDTEMRSGCGHMPQSSLPVGGENTHAVLSSHTGGTSKLFTDLEEMEVGDQFFIHILNITLAYEVESVDVVLPTEIDKIKIESGRDLCTLITCTPYGVNTHRLLVKGHRVDYTEPEEDIEQPVAAPVSQPEEIRPSTIHYLQGILIGLGLSFAILLVGLIIYFLCRKRKKGRKKDG